MSFLSHRRSIAPEPKLTPIKTAVENVPTKSSRRRTTSGMRLIKHVSSIFVPRKKNAPKLGDANNASKRGLPEVQGRLSVSSSQDSYDSDEDDIRRPSGLGDSVSIRSNRSLPPSPFTPISPQSDSDYTETTFVRTRAMSSPNLLRSIGKPKTRPRNGSVFTPAKPLLITPRTPFSLPQEIIVLVFSNLPHRDVADCASLSRAFASAARVELYHTIDFDSLSPTQSEKLVALLGSRRDLTEMVRIFICRKWPAFFLSGSRHTKDQDALLTAALTLAFERMPNLQSLTLPSFDASLLAYHTAFGLKSVSFLCPMSDTEIKALFNWLDGQTNINSLNVKHLEGTNTKTKSNKTSGIPIPAQDWTKAGTAPSSPLLKPFLRTSISPYVSPASSPHSEYFSPHQFPLPPDMIPSTHTLLPNLATLDTTPSIIALLLLPSLTTALRRPLKHVSLTINTTLYNGLRPVSLMNSLRGVTHLALRFGENVDRRSFEKLLGAAGASLGEPGKDNIVIDDTLTLSVTSKALSEWRGLTSLEISFNIPASNPESKRDEAVYKSLQASLARYKTLSSLRLCRAPDETSHSSRNEFVNQDIHISTAEQTMIDSWIKLCPTLGFITLFSGAQWRGQPTANQRAKLFAGSNAFKFP